MTKKPTRHGSRLHQLLVDLEDEDVPEPPYYIQRTYAGHWQRSAGAWSWWAETADGKTVIGSQWPFKEVLSAHKEGRVVLANIGWGACMLEKELVVEQ